MDADPSQPPTYLFTVRLWHENLGNGDHEWRGKIKHVLSQEERSFRGYEGIGELILSLLPKLRTGEKTLLGNQQR